MPFSKNTVSYSSYLVINQKVSFLMYQNVDSNKPKNIAHIVFSAFASPSSIRRCGNETKPDHVPCPHGSRERLWRFASEIAKKSKNKYGMKRISWMENALHFNSEKYEIFKIYTQCLQKRNEFQLSDENNWSALKNCVVRSPSCFPKIIVVK